MRTHPNPVPDPNPNTDRDRDRDPNPNTDRGRDPTPNDQVRTHPNLVKFKTRLGWGYKIINKVRGRGRGKGKGRAAGVLGSGLRMLDHSTRLGWG